MDSIPKKPRLYNKISDLQGFIQLAEGQTDLPLYSSRLLKYALQAAAKELLPGSRTATQCLRKNFSGANTSVQKSILHNSVFFNNLHVCGSIWDCPVCAAKISEKRKKEVLHAIKLHRGERYGKNTDDLFYESSQGGEIRMITRTIPHEINQPLKTLVNQFTDANNWMKKQRKYKNWKLKIKLIGTILVLEVTHGNNGWHVHVHELLFLDKNINNSNITGLFYDENNRRIQKIRENEVYEIHNEDGIYPQWRDAVRNKNIGETNTRGFDIQNADYAAEYITKWGHEPTKELWLASNELVKQHIKRNGKAHENGTPKGRTPFDLLRDFLLNDDLEAGELFREFANAFKGKKQLHWSHGLKKHFNIKEKSDQEIAQEVEDKAHELGQLTRKEWKNLLKNEARGIYTLIVQEKNFKEGKEYIENLTGDNTLTKAEIEDKFHVFCLFLKRQLHEFSIKFCRFNAYQQEILISILKSGINIAEKFEQQNIESQVHIAEKQIKENEIEIQKAQNNINSVNTTKQLLIKKTPTGRIIKFEETEDKNNTEERDKIKSLTLENNRLKNKIANDTLGLNNEEKILEAIQVYRASTRSEIEKVTEIKSETLRSLLKRMEKNKSLKICGKKGREYVYKTTI